MKLSTHLPSSILAKNTSPSFAYRCYIFCTYGLAGVFAVSGVAKLIDAAGLIATLQQLAFLNDTTVIAIATLLPVFEVGVAIALFLRWKPKIFLRVTLFLFTIFFGLGLYGFYSGWAGDCGCFGGLTKKSFGWGMLLQNGILLSLSAAALVAYYQPLRKRDY